MERGPGKKFTPNQWTHISIDAIWTFAPTLWQKCNHEFHGDNCQIPLRTKCKKALAQTMAAYNEAIGD
jgi:hypothetical protein